MEQKRNQEYSNMEKDPQPPEVKERFYRKPYYLEICRGCFGAANGDCEMCQQVQDNGGKQYENN